MAETSFDREVVSSEKPLTLEQILITMTSDKTKMTKTTELLQQMCYDEQYGLTVGDAFDLLTASEAIEHDHGLWVDWMDTWASGSQERKRAILKVIIKTSS